MYNTPDSEVAGGETPRLHPSGVYLHLPEESLRLIDEYRDGDPYEMGDVIDSEFQRQRISLTAQLVQRASNPCERLLDIGAGEGHITARLQRLPEVQSCVALDLSLTAAVKGKALYPDLEFHVGSAYDLPFGDASFDTVVMNNIWEHVPDPLRMLNEVKRVLGPEGRVVVSTPSRYRTVNLFRVLLGREVAFLSDKHVTEYSVGQVKEQFRWSGFQILDVLSTRSSLNSRRGKLFDLLARGTTSAMRSHHQLDQTIFYLAQKIPTR